MRYRLALGAAVAGLVLLGACGGDGDEESSGGDGGDSDADSYIEAKAADLRDAEDGLGLEEPGATCYASVIVEVFGRDRLVDAGITPEELADESLTDLDVDLPDSAAADLSAGLEECDLLEQLEADTIDTFVADFRQDLPPDGPDCLLESLNDEAFADAAAATFLGDQVALQETIFTAMRDCPAVPTAMLLAEQPDLSAQGQACVAAYVEANTAHVVDSVTADDTARNELAVELATACPDFQGS
jgi:hypothetical protein